MSNDELFKALSMFEGGVRKAAVSSAINNVSQEVEAINQQQVGLLEKRQAQTQLANGLAAKLAGLGADATTINASVGAIAPPQVKDSADMYQQGMMAGDEAAVGMANKMQSFETKWQRENLNQTQAFQGSENQKNRDNALEIAGLKATKAGKPVPPAQLKKIEEIDLAEIQINGILDDVNNKGMDKYLGPANSINWLGIRGNVDPEYGQFTMQLKQSFDDYRVKVTGAGAGPSEIAQLRKSTFSKDDTPDVLRAKAAKVLEIGRAVKERKAKRLKSLGYNIGDLEAELNPDVDAETKQQGPPPADAAPAGVPAGSRKASAKNKKTGAIETIWVAPDGKKYKAP